MKKIMSFENKINVQKLLTTPHEDFYYKDQRILHVKTKSTLAMLLLVKKLQNLEGDLNEKT